MESRQLKICCTCFELTQALLRVLEMVIHIAPSVFTDSHQDSSESLLSRLCMVSSLCLFEKQVAEYKVKVHTWIFVILAGESSSESSWIQCRYICSSYGTWDFWG
jgi:hypothetical protein